MIAKVEKFVPLKGGEDVSVMLTVNKKEIPLLVPMLMCGQAELRPVGADVIPESRILLQNMLDKIETLGDDLRDHLFPKAVVEEVASVEP